MEQQEAIVVKKAVKHYRSNKLVLNNLNMTVSKGSIYGLLGASGCGKTTLLSCIVGVQHLNSGEVWVLGENICSNDSGILGPRVGYMPQEISLVGEFTRSSALYYFGRINGLEDDEIDARQRFLSTLLQLPPEDRLVKNMSGGQQRRVSFAAALIHNPELLILDEPTVGLDPILRESIWNYLIKITQDESVTVVITTHYIEEAKDANKIGLMRDGRLLAESSSQQLLGQFQTESLEEVFLILIQMLKSDVTNTNIFTAEEHKVEVGNSEENVLHQEQAKQIEIKSETLRYERRPERKVLRWKRFKALMTKNGIQFLRYYTGIAFAVIFPILQIYAFFGGIGGDPKGLSIGIVNDEAGNCDYGSNFGNISYDEQEYICHFGNLSCRFLQNFDFITTKKYYDNIAEATAATQHEKLVGVMHFYPNFSEALQKRVEYFTQVEEADILTSQIEVFLDMGDRQIGLFVRKKLLDHFFEVYKGMMKDCRISSKFAELPIRFEDPIYGKISYDIKYYMTPPFILIVLFFLATTISTSLIITDRTEGVWKRSLVQGVTTSEILLAHILTQVVIIIIHIVITVCIFFFICGMEYKGSLFVVILFGFFSGFCGLMYGFFVSVICTNHTTAHYISVGSFFPLIVLCGCMWPIEAMPKMLRWISLSLPITYPAISLRGIIDKGYSISEPQVFSGLFVMLAWILFFFIICILKLRSKSS